MTPPPLPATCSVEALAEWLRFTTVTRVQRLDPSDVRPFAESAGRDGWLACAQDLRALLDAKVREAIDAARDDTDMFGNPISANFIVSRVLGAAK